MENKLMEDTLKVIKIGLIMLCIANPLLGLIAGITLIQKNFTEEYRKMGKMCVILSIFLIVLGFALFAGFRLIILNLKI